MRQNNRKFRYIRLTHIYTQKKLNKTWPLSQLLKLKVTTLERFDNKLTIILEMLQHFVQKDSLISKLLVFFVV